MCVYSLTLVKYNYENAIVIKWPNSQNYMPTELGEDLLIKKEIFTMNGSYMYM